MREFGLTKHQIERALNDGVLNRVLVRNPHFKSGPPARMLFRAEIKQNLSKIMAYPMFSPEEVAHKRAKRKTGKVRSNARDEAEFFCETCQSKVRAPPNYPPFEWYCQGKISREHIVKLLRRHHIKHQHTNFEEVYKRRIIHNVRTGMELSEAAAEAQKYADQMVKKKTLP
jgi:hypothetical protein